jgi:rhodanese-related sulfurtransferase
MGATQSVKKINFEDMKSFIVDPNIIIINTMPSSIQECLIINTLNASEETTILNDLLKKNNKHRTVVVYGMNACDDVIVTKYNQLIKLGFYNVYVYPGGLFEWLLLQDIYGSDSFPTTKKELDILQFKGSSLSTRLMITNDYP